MFVIKVAILFLIALSTHFSVHAQTNAQIILEKDLKNPVSVHIYALVQNGDGCTHVTKRAGHPLSREQCRELLESYGRMSPVDIRNPMMQVIMDPIIYPGEVFVYVTSSSGKGWIFHPFRND